MSYRRYMTDQTTLLPQGATNLYNFHQLLAQSTWQFQQPQCPFQEPKLEVPFLRPIFQACVGEYPRNIWPNIWYIAVPTHLRSQVNSHWSQIPVLVSTFSFALPGRPLSRRASIHLTERRLVGHVALQGGGGPRTCSQWVIPLGPELMGKYMENI